MRPEYDAPCYTDDEETMAPCPDVGITGRPQFGSDDRMLVRIGRQRADLEGCPDGVPGLGPNQAIQQL